MGVAAAAHHSSILYQTLWQYPDRNCPKGSVECRRACKNWDFRPILRFISEMIQDMAIVTIECE